jgi:hypothetical protein
MIAEGHPFFWLLPFILAITPALLVSAGTVLFVAFLFLRGQRFSISLLVLATLLNAIAFGAIAWFFRFLEM